MQPNFPIPMRNLQLLGTYKLFSQMNCFRHRQTMKESYLLDNSKQLLPTTSVQIGYQ